MRSAWLWWVGCLALAALAFAVLSFWWLNARRGRLKSYRPHSYAARVDPDLTLLRLPLVFYNTGAAPIVVQNLRVRFPDESGDLLGFPWRITRKTLRPMPDDYLDLPAVFSVPGRTAVQMFVEFGGPWPGFAMIGKEFRVVVDVRLGHKETWTELLEFSLLARGISAPDQYIAYGNEPNLIPDDAVEKANAELADLLAKLEKSRRSRDDGNQGDDEDTDVESQPG